MSVKVVGLRDLRRDLRRVEDAEGLAELRVGLLAAARIVAQVAARKAASFSSTAALTIRPTSSGGRAFVVGGKAALEWYGWADFGSRTPVTGNPRSKGPWSGSGPGPAKGRFLYPAIEQTRPAVVEAVAESLNVALRRVGL